MRAVTLSALSVGAAGIVLTYPIWAGMTATAQGKSNKTTQDLPKSGVKSPGVQIPWANLVFEAEIPVKDLTSITASNSILVSARQSGELLRIDPRTNKPRDPITGLKDPCSVPVTAFGSLWMASCETKSLLRLDPKTGEVKATLPIGADNVVTSLAATADSVWVLTDGKTTLSRVDPSNNTVVAEFRIPSGCRSLISGEGALWAACPAEDQVLRIDAQMNVVDKYLAVSARPIALAVGAGSVWALCDKDGKVDRIDPKANKVAATVDLGVPNAGGDVAFGGGFVWVTQTGFPLTRIDPESNTVVQQFWGSGGGLIAAGADAIWLGNVKEGTLWRIDPKRVRATLAE